MSGEKAAAPGSDRLRSGPQVVLTGSAWTVAAGTTSATARTAVAKRRNI